MSDIMCPQPNAIFGDLTIVHNINFSGQANPMQNLMNMQQQNAMIAAAANMQRLAMQQMNMVAQRELALENKIDKIKQIGLFELEDSNNNNTIPKLTSHNEGFKNKDAEDVEYIVQDETTDSTNSKENKNVVEDAEVIQVNKTRLLDFFDEDGDFRNDKYSYDKLYKIPEDVRTLVCFTIASKENPLEWRDKFRKAYLAIKKQAFKGENSIRLTDETRYVVIVEIKSQYHIIYIKKSKDSDFESNFITKEDKDSFSEFVMGIKSRFDSWNISVEPFIENDTVKNYSKNNQICAVKKDCLFSNGYYIIDQESINKYSSSI